MESQSKPGPRPQVFLSYATEDYEKVKKLHDRLLDVGYRPWIDKEGIPPGSKWMPAIERAIQSSDFFLACLSKNSVNKKGVLQAELRGAMHILYGKKDTDIYLIPVRLDDCDPPSKLRPFQYVDLYIEDEWSESGWEHLDRGIKAALTRERPQGVQPGIVEESPIRGSRLVASPGGRKEGKVEESAKPGRTLRPTIEILIKILPVLVPVFSFAGKLADHRLVQRIRGEVSQTNSIVTVDRPGSEWDVLLYYFIYYLVAAAMVWFIFRYVAKRPDHGTHAERSPVHTFYTWTKILGSAGGIVLIGFLLSLFVLEPKVGPMTDIGGWASDQSRSYYLLVRPVGSALCWLQSPIPLLPGQDGKWNTTAFFGGTTGQRFEIIAIASKTPLHVTPPNSPSSLQPFNKPDSYNCNLIPSDVERYVRVVVIQ